MNLVYTILLRTSQCQRIASDSKTGYNNNHLIPPFHIYLFCDEKIFLELVFISLGSPGVVLLGRVLVHVSIYLLRGESETGI